MTGTTCSWKNLILYDGFGLLFQVIFAFTFLTIFFFTYVVVVEQKQFEEQINFVVDTLLPKDTIQEILKDISGTDKVDPVIITTIVSGLLDGLSFKIDKLEHPSVVDVVNNNNKIRTSSLTLLSGVLTGLIILTSVLLLLGFCIPVQKQIVSALWVLLFIALCELVFLELIASRYKSADPNKVKNEIGSAIVRWICTNKPKICT
jgi:hypothetical protein